MVREISENVGRPVGILVDLAGPKMARRNHCGSVECVDGSIFLFPGAVSDRMHHFVTTYPTLVDELLSRFHHAC